MSFGLRLSHERSYKIEAGKSDVAWSHWPTAVAATELPKEFECSLQGLWELLRGGQEYQG